MAQNDDLASQNFEKISQNNDNYFILRHYFENVSHYNDLLDIFFLHHLGRNGLPY